MTAPPTATLASSVSQVTPRMLASLPSLGVVLGLAVAGIAAAVDWPLVALVALAASAVSEPFLHQRQPVVVKALRAASLGLGTRLVLRLLVAAIALAHGAPSRGHLIGVGLAMLAFVGVRALYVLVAGQLGARRLPVVETRNISWAGLRVPPPLPRVLTSWSGSAVSALELLITVPACLHGLPGAAGVALAALAVVLQATVVAALALDSRRIGHTLGLEGMLPVVQEFVDTHRPEVVLYFGDGRAAVYQVKMWLAVLEALPQRCAVVLRSRLALADLGPTSLPVLCVPAAVSLMALDLAPVKVALYVSNIGNNIHLLREPGMRSVFIGHGDSDKNGSFSPYTRVYEEVWVAGPAGRERYRQADVGVPDSAVVEVGRPQLDAVGPTAERPPAAVPTVLYAPTWEGWNEEQAYGSVASHGVALAEALLRPGSGVRLVYRPHPFTGQRDPAVRAAHQRITALVEAANARDGHRPPAAVSRPQADAVDGSTDPVLASQQSGATPDPLSATAAQALGAAAETAYWAASDPAAHHVVLPDGPSLLSCFDVADVLVTDVSSVLSEFVATGRPHVVCNTSGLTEAEFLAQAPSARAALVLAPDADPEVVARLARGEVPDERSGLRAELRTELLGPAAPPATVRFASAVASLIERAGAARAGTARAGTVRADLTGAGR